MINPDLKKIFNAASKKNEAFVREAISVFPKVNTKRIKLVDVSASDIKIIKGFRFNKVQEGSGARDVIKMSGQELNPTIENKEIEGVIKGLIKKPTGKFKKS